jgi:hypothetical protein
MLATEAGELKRGILGDACGLGKAIQMFIHIVMAVEVNEMKAPYRPTLFLVPATLLEALMVEHDKWFRGRLNVHVFHVYHRSKVQTRLTIDSE